MANPEQGIRIESKNITESLPKKRTIRERATRLTVGAVIFSLAGCPSFELDYLRRRAGLYPHPPFSERICIEARESVYDHENRRWVDATGERCVKTTIERKFTEPSAPDAPTRPMP